MLNIKSIVIGSVGILNGPTVGIGKLNALSWTLSGSLPNDCKNAKWLDINIETSLVLGVIWRSLLLEFKYSSLIFAPVNISLFKSASTANSTVVGIGTKV